MILYHGSNVVVEVPEPGHGLRAMDFGPAFYTTSSREQALRWARSVTKRPNATAKYKAVLRECGNENDTTVVVPDVYKPIVFEATDKVNDGGWKELFANASTIYLSGNPKAANFLETHYKPIAEYVKTRIDKSRRRQS